MKELLRLLLIIIILGAELYLVLLFGEFISGKRIKKWMIFGKKR